VRRLPALALAAATFALAACSQELPRVDGLDGRWEGTVAYQGATLRLIFRVESSGSRTNAFLDAPDLAAMGIPVSRIRRDGDVVVFEVARMRSRYDGVLDASGEAMTGTWSAAGNESSLDLVHGELEAGAPDRPQTPEPPFPYTEEEVIVRNPALKGMRLACTLTVPEGSGPHPAAFLISGSGAQDRDETLLGHKPFWVLADHLTRAGIAVLRCDDRGAGSEGGAWGVPSEFATDAEASLAFLRARPDIDPARTGLIGHSEGGVTGPMVAARDRDLAFLVMMAGPGVPGVDLLTAQSAEIARANGVPEDVLERARAANRAIFEAVVAARNETLARAAAKTLMLEMAAADGTPMEVAERMADTQARRVASRYMRALLAYDPGTFLPQITAPVLAINGSKDTQVPAWQNLPALRELFADHPDARIVELEGLNHLFQTAETGAPGEYGDIEETFSPVALETISDWITEQVL
jgi:pimeloyl-ACP methyl ester carboxylesterase